MTTQTTYLPPLYRQARKLLTQIELAVRGFARYHKYTIGSDLRRQAMALMRAVHRAVFDRTLEHVRAVVGAVDDLKLSLQLAHDVGAFPRLVEFVPIAELLADMGRQCGGWQRSVIAAQGQHSASSEA